ncbi:phosphotransferase [Thiomicrospira sp. ALE5]|uniref:phosphotransferase n=1 Tax=Thiomicrospira sp. ALE5 TaxID=748650 RepID=UPI0008E0428D|nr:phosphotransferase [Thiomicrospira sp. ALE5]SFR59406.1 Ser/Thr protein kinase RdoA involved in Cpx stress response, MazF antagonist [Thiomicrospira sp. ALE5]
MTDIWVPNTPAFEGLLPHEVSWLPLDCDQAEQIRSICGFDGRIERMVSYQAWPRGYYRVLNHPSYFLKITDKRHAQRQFEADHIVEYLQAKGVTVNRLLLGFPKSAAELGDATLSLMAYPYLNAEFIQPNCFSLTMLGEAMAHLHSALAEAPFSEQVKSRGLKRHKALIERWRQSKEQTFSDQEAQAILAQADKTLLGLLIEDAQCVHGDLNFGNVMLDCNNHVVFLDFEDAQSAWFNPLKDLAFVIERFILIHQPQDMGAQLNALLSSYYRVYPKRFDHADHLVGFLQALAVRSLLILSEAERQGRSVPHSEWEKFVFLYKLAQQNQSRLQDILCQLTLT